MRVLLVEDDADIAQDLIQCLTTQGYLVEHCDNGKEAWFTGETEEYSAIILDLSLPGMDGLQVLRQWREAGLATPVLVLSARGSWMERVEGIALGADDYLPKPFQIEELLARLQAIIRRTGSAVSSIIRHGSLVLDNQNVRLKVNGISLDTTPLEFRAISYLLHHQGRIVSRTELAEQVYGKDEERSSNAVEALVARLRRKVGADLIKTKRGLGYCVDHPDDRAEPTS